MEPEVAMQVVEPSVSVLQVVEPSVSVQVVVVRQRKAKFPSSALIQSAMQTSPTQQKQEGI